MTSAWLRVEVIVCDGKHGVPEEFSVLVRHAGRALCGTFAPVTALTVTGLGRPNGGQFQAAGAVHSFDLISEVISGMSASDAAPSAASTAS